MRIQQNWLQFRQHGLKTSGNAAIGSVDRATRVKHSSIASVIPSIVSIS